MPALYRDMHWQLAKGQLDRLDLQSYRNQHINAESNRALAACATFPGDVLIIESEHDDVVPHSTIANYLASFRQARSLTYRMIDGADHALSDRDWRRAYTSLLVGSASAR